MKKILLPLVCCAIASPAFAGGYRASIQGQKALGMGHTGVASTANAEAVFFNPGALTRLESDLEVAGGLMIANATIKYQNEDLNTAAETDNGLTTVPNLYIAGKLNDELSLGFGVYVPFGSSVKWEDDWAGSHLIENIKLSSVFLQPTVSYDLGAVSVGFAPIIAVSSVELERNLNTSTRGDNGERTGAVLEESGIIDFGYSLGVFGEVSDGINLGLQYRSRIDVEANTKATFKNVPSALTAQIRNGKAKSEVPLPAELTLGVSWQATEKVRLAFDYNYTWWSAYEELTFDFDGLDLPNANPSVNPRNYKDTSTFRVGAEYAHSDSLTLRAGLYYDQTPIRDGYYTPETPRADSIGYTAGLSWEIADNLELDTSLLYLYFGEQDKSYDFNSAGKFEGTYLVSALVGGIGLTYRL